jgi:hypothetical protein
MRRFVSLAVLVFFTIPFGASIVGCGHKTITQYCNGGDSGPIVGQAKSITLSPNFAVFGESVDFGKMGSFLNATAVDCKGEGASVKGFTYATTDMTFADINPSTGQVCGGTWNRNTGGGIADYTTCTAPTAAASTITAAVTAASASASITADVIAAKAVTFTANNGFAPGQLVTLSGLSAASFLNGQTLPVASATPTAFTISYTTANPNPNPPTNAEAGTATTQQITLTATKPFIPGQLVTFSGLTAASFLNGQTLPVISASALSFTVNYTNPPVLGVLGNVPATGTVASNSLVAFVTATADGAVSNSISVFVHPTVSNIVIGNPTSSCSTDPDTSCCPVSTGAVITAPAYTGGACLSQGVNAQLTARAFYVDPNGVSQNITCQVGHLQYAAQNSSVLTIDQNGVATAQQPGSTIVSASISSSGSGGAAGFFSTCPPASIQLTLTGSSAISGNVNVNTSQPLTAIVKDANNVTLTGVNLEFNSTTPSTIPAGTGSVTPIFPGTATITAVCQPSTCNSATLSQVGLFGNGEPITSNGVQITAPGTVTSVLYIASTQSQYLLPIDFTTGQQGTLLKLPYVPNSMVITNDGSSVYLGSSTELMSLTTANNTLGNATLSAPGTVLSVSPNGAIVVVTDPIRKTVSLVVNGGVSTSTGGVGTSAKWSPDSHTVYIAAQNNTLLVHSDYNGWSTIPTTLQYNDVAVAVPSYGAFFATTTNATEARSYCPFTSSSTPGNPPSTTNTYYPFAGDTSAQTDRIAATNDGLHILGATAATTPATLTDIVLAPPTSAILDCTTSTTPITFGTTPKPHTLTNIPATAITGVFPASNSAFAFVTYNGTSGFLPEYIPATGTVSNVTLSGAAIDPVTGVFSSDDKTFFTGTSPDNQIHLITITGTTATDTSVIAPKLPIGDGSTSGTATPNLLVQRPKKSTS